ncbi:MAG: FG-GAP-like repeat-containing protein [Planctomycetota bacterium]
MNIRRALPRTSHLTVVLLALAAFTFTTAPARAQLGFTEFALTDPDLNSSPETDFWIASAAPADVDADGDLDLLIAGYYVVYFQSVEERLTLYRNDGRVNATTWALTPVPVDPGGLYFNAADLAWGDYDNDGDPDVVVAAYGETALYRNDAGTLARTSTVLPAYLEDPGFSTLDLHSVSWADFDNDGDLDLLLPSIDSMQGPEPARLLRNDGAGVGDAWTFTDLAVPLPPAANAVSAWADMDRDGDLDLMLGNVSPYGDNFLETYRNVGGSLQLADTALAFIRYGTADWGDVDGDGDMDIVYAGNIDLPDGTGETVVRILFGDGQGGWTPLDAVRTFQSPAEPWLDFNAVTWADYDSDGDMDLLVSGEWLGMGEIFGRSEVYANTGGTFSLASDPLPAPIAGNAGGAFTWFDVDSDGDLDYFVAGAYYVPNGSGLVEARAQLFRNEATTTNAAPDAPSGLTEQSPNPNTTILAWNASTDDTTPTASISYDLEITPAGGGVFGERTLPEPGRVGSRTTWTLRGLRPGVYRWAVRAVDSAFNGSASAQGIFSVEGGPGAAFCFGDGSLATPCPCANSGAIGHGCASSRNPDGAALTSTGTTSPDTVVLTSWGEPPNSLSIFLQGNASIANGVVFGDGLRCTGGSLKRLRARNASGGVVSFPVPGDPSITARSATLGDSIAPGSTRYYQTYYRDVSTTFCPGATFNASSAIRIDW